jgi:hypothetical protein
MGLLIFTMMMKTVRITKSLVKEIRTFCMRLKKQGPYQPLVAAVELLCRQLRLDWLMRVVLFLLLRVQNWNTRIYSGK